MLAVLTLALAVISVVRTVRARQAERQAARENSDLRRRMTWSSPIDDPTAPDPWAEPFPGVSGESVLSPISSPPSELPVFEGHETAGLTPGIASLFHEPLPQVEAPVEAPPRDRPRWRRLAGQLRFYVVVLLVAVLVNTFVVKAFLIPSSSMEPTIRAHDRVLVNELSYRFHDVRRGDIVVLKSPEPDDGSGVDQLIKRVIGLPGDRIDTRDYRIAINGRNLIEPYLRTGVLTTDLPSMVVPPGQYLVLGDNREDSEDGRTFGPVPRSSIVGRAFLRFWPLPSIGWL